MLASLVGRHSQHTSGSKRVSGNVQNCLGEDLGRILGKKQRMTGRSDARRVVGILEEPHDMVGKFFWIIGDQYGLTANYIQALGPNRGGNDRKTMSERFEDLDARAAAVA
jgi:hypothetical protein